MRSAEDAAKDELGWVMCRSSVVVTGEGVRVEGEVTGRASCLGSHVRSCSWEAEQAFQWKCA